MTPQRLLAPVITMIVIATSCGSSDSSDAGTTDVVTTDVVTEPSVTEVATEPDDREPAPAEPVVTEPAPTDAPAADPTTTVDESSDDGEAGEQEVTDVAFASRMLVAGERYSTLNLGVDVEFTAPRDLFVGHNRPGIVVMIDGYDAATGDYPPETGVALGLHRWAGWSTRDEAALDVPTASIDPYDVDAWLESNDLVLLSDETTEIADRPARVFDVTVDPSTTVQAATGSGGRCFPGWEPCFHIGADASGDERNRYDWVSGQRVTRFYLVTIEGSEPLLIQAGAPPQSTWFDEIESTFIDTLEIGPDRPPLDPA